MAELSAAAAYRVLIGSRVRSQLAYRSSFWLTVLTSFAIGSIELLEIYAILHNVPVFGGLDFRQAAVVFAFANLGFGLADLVFGQLDSIPTALRLGRLEVLLVRPMPLMLQLITADFQLRKLGRASAGLIILVAALSQLELPTEPRTIYLIAVTPIVGAAIYGAFFATAGGVQFFLVDGAEFTAAFVYGGNYASQMPAGVLLTPVRLLFTFVFPATVAAYLPTVLMLGLPGPAYLPAWLGWCAPAFAAWAWLVAALCWRAGTHRFTGAGG